jgi:hypothetical protein
MPEPVQPFLPGDRVRCVVSTVVAMRGIELRGRVGTVQWATYYAEGDLPGWEVTVAWEGLRPGMLAHHSPEELALVGR